MSELTTEEKIFIAARKVFLKKGFAGARMQEIADESGINKALLHYYFRNKKKLFEKIFQQILGNVFLQLTEVINTHQPLTSKVAFFVEKYTQTLLENPDLPLFVINELNQNPDFLIRLAQSNVHFDWEMLETQIKEEVEQGRMRYVKPQELLINIISLCAFPILAQPLAKTILNMDQDAYHEMIHQRKKSIVKIVLPQA
ncbi:TetR/AcrR family transcriptional regulator [Rapidithrix thailandica]|uniref:TetR/AcrR family transcriptional regulator n=1 Tax=Rapidithrix thailandica TaxID=413964 RepID=A0AAW9S6N6_9BACT